MDSAKKSVKKYGTVMPRVNNRSRSSLKTSTSVLQRIPRAKGIGGKSPSNPNIRSGVYKDLPVILNDYVPDSPDKKAVKQTLVVRPKRTIKSMVPEKTLPRFVHRKFNDSSPNIRKYDSAPSVVERDINGWSDSYVRQCFSSRSHTRLKELRVCEMIY